MRRLILPVLIAVVPLIAVQPVAAVGITKCVIEVDGTFYLNGPCNFERESDGSFEIGVGPPGVASQFFAYLVLGTDGESALGYWNSPDAGEKAYEDLGPMTRDGACWVSAAARLCAYK